MYTPLQIFGCSLSNQLTEKWLHYTSHKTRPFGLSHEAYCKKEPDTVREKIVYHLQKQRNMTSWKVCAYKCNYTHWTGGSNLDTASQETKLTRSSLLWREAEVFWTPDLYLCWPRSWVSGIRHPFWNLAVSGGNLQSPTADFSGSTLFLNQG